MNKEFKKCFDKKMKDNTNKYVVMYKTTIVIVIVLLFGNIILEIINYFNNNIPYKIIETLCLVLIYMFYPLYCISNKIFKEENEISHISKCKTKKDRVILKIYNVTKVILLVGFGLLFFVAGFVNEILGFFKDWHEGEKIFAYILFAIFFIFERASSYLDKRNIT